MYDEQLKQGTVQTKIVKLDDAWLMFHSYIKSNGLALVGKNQQNTEQ